MAAPHAGPTKTIPYIQRTDDLEYRLTSFIRALTVKDRPKVALATPAENPQVGSSFQALREALGENHEGQSLFLGPDSVRLGSDCTPWFSGSEEHKPSHPSPLQ